MKLIIIRKIEIFKISLHKINLGFFNIKDFLKLECFKYFDKISKTDSI